MIIKSAIRTDSPDYRDSVAAMKKLVDDLNQKLAMIEVKAEAFLSCVYV